MTWNRYEVRSRGNGYSVWDSVKKRWATDETFAKKKGANAEARRMEYQHRGEDR